MANKNVKVKIPPPPSTKSSAEKLAAYFEKYGLEELEAAGYVHDLTPAERKAMERLSAACREKIEARKNRRTQLNLAMSAEQLQRFTKYANRRHIPASTLAKSWILERLDQEAKRRDILK